MRLDLMLHIYIYIKRVNKSKYKITLNKCSGKSRNISRLVAVGIFIILLVATGSFIGIIIKIQSDSMILKNNLQQKVYSLVTQIVYYLKIN